MGSLQENPLAVKILDNRLYIYRISSLYFPDTYDHVQAEADNAGFSDRRNLNRNFFDSNMNISKRWDNIDWSINAWFEREKQQAMISLQGMAEF